MEKNEDVYQHFGVISKVVKYYMKNTGIDQNLNANSTKNVF